MDDFNFFEQDLGTLAIQKTMKIKTLREGIYLYLRDAIIKQKIKPNERLQENNIAKELNVSKTPIREAFLKLHSEGYITLDAHRSVTVKPISYSELIEIYQVMSVLDGFASSLALKKMEQSFLKDLQELTKKMESFYKKEMIEEYLDFNAQIHSLIWETSGNKYLNISIYNAQNQMLRYRKERLSFYSKPGIMQKSIRSHIKILKAFMTSDNDNIEKIVRSHWNISGILN